MEFLHSQIVKHTMLHNSFVRGLQAAIEEEPSKPNKTQEQVDRVPMLEAELRWAKSYDNPIGE